MHLRLLFICKSRSGYTQGRFGLWNSATFVINVLKAHGVDADIVDAVDANCIDRLITEHKPHVVILEAIWAPPAKLRELVKLHPAVRFIVRVHSKMTFLATEGIAVDWLHQMAKVPGVHLSGNNYEFTRDMAAVGLPCLYLPNIYAPPYRFIPTPRNDGKLHIGCFGSPRPMKNQLAQACAAISFADKIGKQLAFHINGTTLDQGTQNVVKNLRGLFEHHPTHNLVEHEWQSHEDFCRLVATMDLGMQVSLSESFNIVSADFVWNGVPVIVSDEISFVHPHRQCCNSTVDIVKALTTAYNGVANNDHAVDMRLLMSSNDYALRAWFSVLGI